MIATAKEGLFDKALIHGWQAYELGEGDIIAMDNSLTNLGQLFLDIGHAQAARAAFASVLSRPQPASIGLPALGGIAGAAARLGDSNTVAWAASEAVRQTENEAYPYQMADALLECAAALQLIRSLNAEECLVLAESIAARFGYEELRRRVAERRGAPPNAAGKRVRLAPRAMIVARDVEALAPARLPNHIVIAAVA